MRLSKPKEQRQHNRFEATIRALVIVESNDVWRPHTFWTENVSLGGMLVRGEDPSVDFVIGSRLNVEAFMDEDSPGTSVAVTMEVVHIVPPNKFGLIVVGGNTSKYEHLLTAYVSRHPDKLLFQNFLGLD